MNASSKALVDKALDSLHLGDVYSFSQKQLIDLMQKRVNECETEIETYRQKYKMDLSELKSRFHELNQFTISEKEDDCMQWEDSVLFLNSYQQTLKELKNA